MDRYISLYEIIKPLTLKNKTKFTSFHKLFVSEKNYNQEVPYFSLSNSIFSPNNTVFLVKYGIFLFYEIIKRLTLKNKTKFSFSCKIQDVNKLLLLISSIINNIIIPI